MASKYTNIRQAIEKYLSATSGIPTIAWENVDYKPSTDTPFVKFQFLPTSRRPSTMSVPNNRYQGIVRLLVKYPENSGPGTSQGVVDTLIDRFEAYTYIRYNTATNSLVGSGTGPDIINVSLDYAQQESSYITNPWYVTPITVGWHCYD